MNSNARVDSASKTVRAARYAREKRTLVSRLLVLLRAFFAWLRAALPDIAVFGALTGLSVAAMSTIFPPHPWWPLAFVGLLPWTIGVCRVHRAWVVHWGSFLGGWVFFLINLAWLYPVTDLGFVALAFYLAIYWTLAAWALRTGRRIGLSVAWTLPVVWVATEYLRGWVMTGFPWLFVGHAFYEWPMLIQIADFAGAFGVSALALLVCGALAEWGLVFWKSTHEPPRRRQAMAGTAAAAAAIAGALLYGKMRIDSAVFEEGPRIAVLQDDFVLSSSPPYSAPNQFILARYFALAAQAARAEPTPDLIVFPETPWGAVQNRGFLDVPFQAVDDVAASAHSYGKTCHNLSSALAIGDYGLINQQIARMEIQMREYAAQNPLYADYREFPRLPASGPSVPLLLGAMSIDVFPSAVYPKHKKFNSAFFYHADGRQDERRYDKMHLVPFGEFVPFRQMNVLGFDLHWLYTWLNKLSPFSFNGRTEYSLWAGTTPVVFPLEHAGRMLHFGVPICYEDVVPRMVRKFVWDGANRRADFLVNISNDGWFQHSDELAQHMAAGVFRAIENRVGIARSVNTGMSGFIDPVGRMYSLVNDRGRIDGPGIIGYSIDTIRLDRRSSVYGRVGDAFAVACVLATTALWIGAIVTRWILATRDRIVRWLSPKETSA
ncbi:MAG: hypothetical protein AMXMBFR47_00040 [Planctomycetota bacterium]